MSKDTILKRRMEEAGISQRDAARSLGRHFQHINYVVNGVRKSKSLSLRILQLCSGQIPLSPKPVRRRKVKNDK